MGCACPQTGIDAFRCSSVSYAHIVDVEGHTMPVKNVETVNHHLCCGWLGLLLLFLVIKKGKRAQARVRCEGQG